MIDFKSASSIGCVAVVAQEKRQMIVRVAAAVESDRNLGVNAGAPLVLEVCTGREGEPIEARGCFGRQAAATAVGIGGALGQQQPRVFVEHFEPHADSCGGLAEYRVEN